MNKRILIVDDEQHILDGMKRNLRKEFEVTVALGGVKAIEILQVDEVPFAVIMSDMRMPEMNGVEFLSQVKEIAPESVRLMLTGNADQETAVDALNKGEVFRFLNKPCEQEVLEYVLNQAVRQYQLLTAEKDILQKTVKGSIEALVEVMSLSSPYSFGRVKRIQERCAQIIMKIPVKHMWEMDAAALLSQIGCITIPEEILTSIFNGEKISDDDKKLYLSHPTRGAELINKIPRLENVANIVSLQFKNFDGSGLPLNDISGVSIPIEARILRAVLALEEKISAGLPEESAVQELSDNVKCFDPAVIEVLRESIDSSGENKITKVHIDDLLAGMILHQDLCAENGVLLACKGLEITGLVKNRIENFRKNGTLSSGSILVAIPEG